MKLILLLPLNNKGNCSFKYSLLLAIWAPFIGAQSTFVTETRQDLEIAIDNFPERVKTGPEIRTILGYQITPGTLPRDFRINQQIYNDIAELNGQMNNLMQMILNIPVQPTIIDSVELNMNKFIQLLTNAGIRYNMAADFNTLRNQLVSIMTEIRGTPITAYFMLFKARLEVIMAEIENALRTKLITT